MTMQLRRPSQPAEEEFTTSASTAPNLEGPIASSPTGFKSRSQTMHTRRADSALRMGWTGLWCSGPADEFTNIRVTFTQQTASVEFSRTRWPGGVRGSGRQSPPPHHLSKPFDARVSRALRMGDGGFMRLWYSGEMHEAVMLVSKNIETDPEGLSSTILLKTVPHIAMESDLSPRTLHRTSNRNENAPSHSRGQARSTSGQLATGGADMNDARRCEGRPPAMMLVVRDSVACPAS
ncbi:hypothetical protein D9611_009088 [Ephemerocybe angulata]|uniref:Uncharacterized protein n=1 Tax=Ephemerocybe angulata TaxID=980116 RepID=A0A8H5FK48_9AGAR|nr:hypothetical protein D9611_009088 [Tulosesus angulatus]